jgi:Tol biopolymer transport system component
MDAGTADPHWQGLYRIAGAILLLAASLGCRLVSRRVPNPLLTPSATVSGEGTLLFTSARAGNDEIYVIQADGTGPTKLTEHPSGDYGAAWSPDGQQIAFVSRRSGQRSVYVMDADGANPRHLYDLDYPFDRPVWSPDGRWIALSNVVLHADGTGVHLATAEEGGGCQVPTWSPDSSRLACTDGLEIAVIRMDGGETTHLRARRINEFPAWSPDGTRIAFRSWNTGFARYERIYTIHPDGSGEFLVTDDKMRTITPAWSPDGTRIAYTGILEGQLALHVIRADGTGKTRLTYNYRVTSRPAWSPDGTRIAFSATRARTPTSEPGEPAPPRGLYIINADGSALVELVAPAIGNGGLSWRPTAP